MKNLNLQSFIRNAVAVIVGLSIYLLIDTIASIFVGIFLNLFTQIHPNSVLFQIALRFIVTAINVRLITLAVNRIAVRNKKGYCIPDYIISAIIIVTGIILCMANLQNKNFEVNGIIFLLFNTLSGIVLLLDAKEEMM